MITRKWKDPNVHQTGERINKIRITRWWSITSTNERGNVLIHGATWMKPWKHSKERSFRRPRHMIPFTWNVQNRYPMRQKINSWLSVAERMGRANRHRVYFLKWRKSLKNWLWSWLYKPWIHSKPIDFYTSSGGIVCFVVQWLSGDSMNCTPGSLSSSIPRVI